MSQEIENRLGYTFKNSQLLTEALTHKSFKQPYNNERLEFLGDAVLDLVVGEYLYKKYDTADEGVLSKTRAALVNEDGFTLLAKHISLGDSLFLSNAEVNNGGREKPSLLSNAFEAVMGAIYLESGIETLRPIVLQLIKEVYQDTELHTLSKDYKTSLQEITQAKFALTPEYKLVSATGPDHQKEFEIALLIDGKEYARAKGKSKKVAQQEAAYIALAALDKE